MTAHLPKISRDEAFSLAFSLIRRHELWDEVASARGPNGTGHPGHTLRIVLGLCHRFDLWRDIAEAREARQPRST